MRAALGEARRGLRARRRRTVLAAVGIALAAAMLSASVVVADGLGLGFDRAAAAAHLPDIIVRFDPESEALVDRRIAALPDLAGYATRFEQTGVGISYGRRFRPDAVAEVVSSTGRWGGYAVVGGHDLRPTGNQVLLEKAFAQAWGVRLGSEVDVDGLGAERVVGFAEGPDNVGFPLAEPRFYLSSQALAARFGSDPNPQVDYAEIWLRDPRRLDEVLVQARSESFGLHDVRFATRAAVHVLLSQAAGIVIDLLVALSLIALVTAGVMLAASARAEVQRRLPSIGVQRAVGAGAGHIVLSHALEALLVSAPAAAAGCAAGLLATNGPADRLLTLLNEPPPGRALTLPVLGAWLVAAGIPVAASAWPAWRATRRPAVALLRGAEVAASGSGRRGARSGLTRLGVRLVAARRARLAATVITLGLSTAFVLLMLSLASALGTLETDPAALGKRYQLTATLPVQQIGRIDRIPGVAAAAPRYETNALDAYSLQELVDVIAYPGDHTRFEAPPLTAGHRLRGAGQAEIGEGLSQALGLEPGQSLRLELPNGRELRLRVAGVVSSLDRQGLVAYVPAAALLSAYPDAPYQIAVRLAAGADPSRVEAALSALGAAPAPAAGLTDTGAPLVAVLRTILRAIALVDGLVCLYALIQACALTVQERRRTIAVLRASGAGTGAIVRLLAGAAVTLVAPAALLGILLERLALGPSLARLAASYAVLPLGAGAPEILVTLAGLVVAAVLAVGWVARLAARESVVAGMAG